MAAYTTYDQVGLAESVDDIISDITPSDCPFYSLVKNEKVNARTFEWLSDELAPSADNAEVEGFEAQDDNLLDVSTNTNTTQIMSKVFNVSGTADAVKTYGRAKETALTLVA
jgi:hypothetical protein